MQIIDQIKQEAILNPKPSWKKLPDEEIESRLAAHEMWIFAKKGGGRANFRNVDFEGLDLSDFILSGAIFTCCNFKNVSFKGADISGCNFRHCDMTGANLENTIKNEKTCGIPVEA